MRSILLFLFSLTTLLTFAVAPLAGWYFPKEKEKEEWLGDQFDYTREAAMLEYENNLSVASGLA